EGKSGELHQLLHTLKSVQEKAVLLQQERDQAVLALQQRQIENQSLQNEVQYLHDKELHSDQELQRLHKRLVQSEDSYIHEVWAAKDRMGKLTEKVTILEENLLSSADEMDKASREASLQVEKLHEQLNRVSRQKEEMALRLSAYQGQEKRCVLALAEWKEKAEHLQGKLVSWQEHLDKAKAVLELKEEQMERLKSQNEVQQEELRVVRQKWTDLQSRMEGKVDKVLMRNIFIAYFQTPAREQHQVLRLIGSTLGIEREEMEQLLKDHQGAVTSWITGWLGGRSRSVPSTPVRPNQQSVLNTSFSEAESHSPTLRARLSSHGKKALDSPGKSKLPKNSAQGLKITPGSIFKRTDGNSCSTVAALISPDGLKTHGSQNLLLNAVAEVLPTNTPLLMSPGESTVLFLLNLIKM
uniref:GRIP domain-containing protein n=1 Tax=Otolemur garnettii TaxID=30611 RepID=H0XJV0_OTOGA